MTLTNPTLPDNPGESEEEHNPPYVQQASHLRDQRIIIVLTGQINTYVDPFDPSKLDHFPLFLLLQVPFGRFLAGFLSKKNLQGLVRHFHTTRWGQISFQG